MTKGKKPESEQLKALRFEKHELVKPIDKKVNEDNVLKNQTKELEKKIEAMQNESGPKIKKIEEQIEATKKEISKLNSEATSLEKELDVFAKKMLDLYEGMRNFVDKKLELDSETIEFNKEDEDDVEKIYEKYEAD
nr:hypothetical protein [Mycoplasmopsis bovis]